MKEKQRKRAHPETNIHVPAEGILTITESSNYLPSGLSYKSIIVIPIPINREGSIPINFSKLKTFTLNQLIYSIKLFLINIIELNICMFLSLTYIMILVLKYLIVNLISFLVFLFFFILATLYSLYNNPSAKIIQKNYRLIINIRQFMITEKVTLILQMASLLSRDPYPTIILSSDASS